jgi:hypothetical protein
MSRGNLPVAIGRLLRAALAGALGLSAAALFADDQSVPVLPPAPTSAPPAANVPSLPTALAAPSGPQLDPPAAPPASSPGITGPNATPPVIIMLPVGPAAPPGTIVPPPGAGPGAAVPAGPGLTGSGSTGTAPFAPQPFVPVPQAPGKPPTGATVLPEMGVDGAPLSGPMIQNPDGSLSPDPLAPQPESAGPPPNPGPPRLRMSDEKEKGASKDSKAADEAIRAIPASLVFRTRDIVRPDFLRGKYYRLAEYTPLVDFNFRFEIETPWGTIPAHGMAMLDLRLRELCSLEYAQRIADKNPMYTEGFAQGICNTAKGACILVTDPIGSVRRTGQVLKRWSLVKKSPGGCKANCESRRRIACLVGCDPETRNEPLACLLDEMSVNASGGWLTVEVGLNFGLPGLGFLPFNTQFKAIMSHRSTLEIQADLDHDLIELGIPEASRTRFFAAQSYTTTERMAFVYYLHKMIGIENLACLVDGAADTHDESEALASIRELQLIADLRQSWDFTRVTFIGVPVLTLDDGTQIIITAADYLVETPRTAQMIAAYRTAYTAVPTKLATVGRVSVGAQQQFKAAGIEVVRHKIGQPEAAAGKSAKTAAKASGRSADSATSSSSSDSASPAVSSSRSS